MFAWCNGSDPVYPNGLFTYLNGYATTVSVKIRSGPIWIHRNENLDRYREREEQLVPFSSDILLACEEPDGHGRISYNGMALAHD